MEPTEILALPMDENDSGATTIKGYLKELLRQIWLEGEGFSGKRPFGNSGWESDLERALVKGGAVAGKLDEDGYPEGIDEMEIEVAIEKAIDAL